MNVENNIKKLPQPRVLLSPLDWGLGHATRCIPIINVLIENNIEVLIAADGPIARLLQKEYPSLVILPLKGYKINYSKKGSLFFLKMLIQFPKIISAINHEKSWLKKTIDDYKIDAIISDNRFGFHYSKRPCVYVTHQLFIETGNSFLNKIAQKVNYRFINKFDECWVPDTSEENNLAGKLSHPERFPSKSVKYLGVLSRCKKLVAEKKYELLIMLSGPEPQRTIFENILLGQIKNIDGKIMLVRGFPAVTSKLQSENKNLEIHDHLPAEILNEVMQQSKNIIARCGYSTIMDLTAIQQKAILVPTPGQTEQEYLASYLMKRKLFFTCTQENFLLKQALKKNSEFHFAQITIDGIQKNIIEDWIIKLKKQVGLSQ